MTLLADDKGNVAVPTEAPGHRFDVQFAGEGKIVLTKVEQSETKGGFKVIKKQGYSVGDLGRPINERALREAVLEFP